MSKFSLYYYNNNNTVLPASPCRNQPLAANNAGELLCKLAMANSKSATL